MAHDDIDHIPTITATRDSDHQRSRPKPGGAAPANGGRRSSKASNPTSSSGGAGIWARLFITFSLVVAAVACAWAWQLQQQFEQYTAYTAPYEQRISDLEDRLSDTDEGLSQNTATMAVRIKDLYSEVDKLWAARNVQKKDIADLEKSSATIGKNVASLDKSLTADQAQLKRLSADVAKLESVAGDLQRLMASAKTNQAEVERVADSLNRMNLQYTKLSKRVETNEEWVRSVNAFRRQVNTTMTQLQSAIRALESKP